MAIKLNRIKTILCLFPLLFLFGCNSVINSNQPINDDNTQTAYDLSFDESTKDSSYDVESSTHIYLNNKDIKITKEGTYILEGRLENSSIVVEAKKGADIQIVLNNVTISNDRYPGIYIRKGNRVKITLADGSVNTISDSSSEQIGSEELDALIYSEADLIINGNGELNLNSENEHGIISKGNLIITGGNYNIETKGQGLRGKGSLRIADGCFRLNTYKDALKSDNYEDEYRGYVYITGGDFDITSYSDAIYGHSLVKIDDGSFEIKTIKSDISRSFKAIKSDKEIIVSDGKFAIESADDGIHCDNDISITGGRYNISAKDDGIHSDTKVEISEGDITIDAHEGIEATYVVINGGDIDIYATDDGINAGQKVKNYSPAFEMNDGKLTIETGYGDADAIDSNGYIYVNGGTIEIISQSPFDYVSGAEFNGGTIIINGIETDEISNRYEQPEPESEESEEETEDFGDQEYYDGQDVYEEEIGY